MIAALLALLPFFDTGLGAFEAFHDWKDFHPQAIGEVKPGTPAWVEGCSNAFRSFSPDTGLWKDAHGKFHYCHLKYVK